MKDNKTVTRKMLIVNQIQKYRTVIFLTITEMLKKRYRKSEIQKILHSYNKGMSIQQITYEHEISQSTFYNWRAKYGSLSTEDKLYLAKIKQENDRLKRMYADLSLENLMLKWQLERYQ